MYEVVNFVPGRDDTIYVGAGTYPLMTPINQSYGSSFTVSDNGSGTRAVAATSGAAIATTPTRVDIDPCDLNEVRITPNTGVSWYVANVVGTSSVSDVVALGDGSWTLGINGPSGFTSATFSVSMASGLSATQLPQGSPLVTLALVPCAPTVGPITAPLTPVPVNTAVAASASFTDPDKFETHTAVWNWGDGTTSTGVVTESNGSGSVSGSHSYALDGVYTITLTVTDKEGGSGQSVYNYVVVYKPGAGFVTGGGWFNSPAGAYAANPTLTGQANFGFTAKYQSGSTVPTGQTEFQFPAANLDFKSTSYDWLVISTNQAQYQGSGTINGAGNYGFLLTALDNGGGSTPDDIRIKIWDKNNNAVVYDSQPGAATTAAPTTALGGGRLQVHTNAQLVAGGPNPSGGDMAPLTSEELQPVVQEAIAGWAAAGLDAGQLSGLRQVTVGIADLPGPWLGMASPGAIWIDQNAAGYGWYIDASPAADSVSPAAPGSPAYGKVDLLTVVEHELGHELGFADTPGDGLMGVYLPTGVRRLSTLDPAPASPAAGPVVSAPLPAAAADAGNDSLVSLGTALPSPQPTGVPLTTAPSGVSSNAAGWSAFQARVLGAIERDLSQWEALMTQDLALLMQTVDQLFLTWESSAFAMFGSRPTGTSV